MWLVADDDDDDDDYFVLVFAWIRYRFACVFGCRATVDFFFFCVFVILMNKGYINVIIM